MNFSQLSNRCAKFLRVRHDGTRRAIRTAQLSGLCCLLLIAVSAAHAQTVGRIIVPEQMMMKKIVSRILPGFTTGTPEIQKLIIAHCDCKVRFKAVVDPGGRISTLTALSGNRALIHSARPAVLRWTFTPPTFDGEPVEVETTLTVRYNFTGR